MRLKPEMDALSDTLHQLQETVWATAIRESDLLFPVIETVHVIALIMVVGTIARLDLRLLGFHAGARDIDGTARRLLPWTWSSFVLALVSGTLMFSSAAVKYAANPFFQAKLVLLVLAGLNMLAFQLGSGRTMAAWSPKRPPPGKARLAGAVSLLLWISVVAAGRWIGYTMH